MWRLIFYFQINANVAVRYFHKGFFKGWKLIPTVQFSKWQLPKFVLAAALGHLDHPNHFARPPPPMQPVAPSKA